MWQSRWGRSSSTKPKRRRPSGRPFLELLESRCLLATNITQYHVDTQSTGANLTETQLTPSNVNAADFGQLYNTPLDGQVYAEPLVPTNVSIVAGPNTVGTPGTYNSVVFVATEHDSLYAIDSASGAILWHARSWIPPTPMTTSGCDFRLDRFEQRREFRRHLPRDWHLRHTGDRPVHEHPLRSVPPRNLSAVTPISCSDFTPSTSPMAPTPLRPSSRATRPTATPITHRST